MTRRTKKSVIESGPQAPSWLRADCRKRFAELLEQFAGPIFKPAEIQTLARLAHVSTDLEAAEAALLDVPTIVTGENGIAYIHPAVKHRNALAAEFRMLLKGLEKRSAAPASEPNSIAAVLARGRIQRALAELRKTDPIPTGVQQREAAQKQAHFAAEQQRSEL
jgi:hypothetical protein